MKKLTLLFLLLAGCATQTTSRSTAMEASALEEVRIALLDVRQAFSAQQMDIQLLDEKMNKLKPSATTSTRDLEKRIQQLEKATDTIRQDLHQLSTHANQTTSSLVDYRSQINALDALVKKQNERLSEIVKLKSTLDSISKAIGATPAPSSKVHKVRSGDSLDKIARRYNTTVDGLKRENGLSSNTILIGQELKIP